MNNLIITIIIHGAEVPGVVATRPPMGLDVYYEFNSSN